MEASGDKLGQEEYHHIQNKGERGLDAVVVEIRLKARIRRLSVQKRFAGIFSREMSRICSPECLLP